MIKRTDPNNSTSVPSDPTQLHFWNAADLTFQP